MTENSVKSLSSRGNDAVKADLIGTTFIDMQGPSAPGDVRHSVKHLRQKAG